MGLLSPLALQDEALLNIPSVTFQNEHSSQAYIITNGIVSRQPTSPKLKTQVSVLCG